MMQDLIRDFSKHLTEAISIGEKTSFSPSNNKIENILICGLGGSGIGGTIISQMLAQECKVPIQVNKDYHIPAFVNEHTLVVCCSYSGNTEEVTDYTCNVIAKQRISDEGQEGMSALLEKRKPNWK